jgi:hypothetical protein
MSQRLVWETQIPVRNQTIYNELVGKIDAQGNAAFLHREYDGVDMSNFVPAATTLLVVSSRGRNVSMTLPATHRDWAILSFRPDSVILEATQLPDESVSEQPRIAYVVKLRNKKLTGEWLPLFQQFDNGSIQNDVMATEQSQSGMYHGWLQYVRPAGYQPVTFRGLGGGELLHPIITAARLMRP